MAVSRLDPIFSGWNKNMSTPATSLNGWDTTEEEKLLTNLGLDSDIVGRKEAVYAYGKLVSDAALAADAARRLLNRYGNPSETDDGSEQRELRHAARETLQLLGLNPERTEHRIYLAVFAQQYARTILEREQLDTPSSPAQLHPRVEALERQNADLVAANNAYLERARRAEALLEQAPSPVAEPAGSPVDMLAEAMASMDGKLERFRKGEAMDASKHNDIARDCYDGYMEDAASLATRLRKRGYTIVVEREADLWLQFKREVGCPPDVRLRSWLRQQLKLARATASWEEANTANCERANAAETALRHLRRHINDVKEPLQLYLMPRSRSDLATFLQVTSPDNHYQLADKLLAGYVFKLPPEV